MIEKIVRTVIGITTSFIALTAVIGGIAILVDIENFSLEWLEGTPFHDYTIPAFILILVVGGSSLLASVTVIMSHRLVHLAAMTAGIIIMGQIVAELLILNQNPPGPHWIEGMYLGLGLIVFGCGFYLRQT